MNSATSRRRFLASSAAAGSLLLASPRTQASVRSANDRVRIAVLGLNGRGKAHLSGYMGLDNVEIAAVVDPDSEVLGRTLKMLDKKAGKATATPAALADFRRVLDDKSIDAVSIAAPNHRHSLMPDADPPVALDWNLWKGPAVIDHYHANLVHYNWHWFWKTGNGDLNNQGTHQLDVACWAIDDDQVHPVRALALGGRFAWRDQGETPNTMFAMAEYANGQKVLFNVRNVNYDGYTRQVENEYYLEDGSVIVGDGPFRIRRPGGKEFEPLDIPPGRVTPGGNWQSFVTAVRAGDPKLANGDVHDAHRGCVLGHLMNNSYRLGGELPFDEKAVRFGDRADAAEHFLALHSIMRDGVGIPEHGTSYRVGPLLTFDPVTERHVGEHAEEANRLLKDPNNQAFEVPSLDRI
jgi:predicted dehydrogenase